MSEVTHIHLCFLCSYTVYKTHITKHILWPQVRLHCNASGFFQFSSFCVTAEFYSPDLLPNLIVWILEDIYSSFLSTFQFIWAHRILSSFSARQQINLNIKFLTKNYSFLYSLIFGSLLEIIASNFLYIIEAVYSSILLNMRSDLPFVKMPF